MNRYILFLVLVSLQVQISFSAISENAQRWEGFEKALEEEDIIIEMFYKFEEKFADTVNKDGSKPELSYKYFFLKNMCRTTISKFLERKFKPTTDPKEQKAIVLQAFILGRACVCNMIQGKAEYEYEKYAIPKQIYDKKIQEQIGIEFANEAYDGFKEGVKGSCSHLVDDEAFTQKLHKKIDKFHKNKG